MKKTNTLSTLPASARCAIYCRFSDQDADSKGAFSSNDAQRLACARFIEEVGASIVAVYSDESKTGTNLKRPGWRSLLQDAQAGKLTHVVVTYTDRLARGEQFTIARYLLSQCGVQVVCAIEQFGDGLAGVMQQQLSMMVSGLWPAITSEKTRAKLAEMVRQGYWTGGRRRLFGFAAVPVEEMAGGSRKPPKRLVVVDQEAQAVREAFRVFVATDSIRSASDVLESASGRAWPDHATRDLLSSPLMVGRHVWGEIENPQFCTPIVEIKLWEDAQALLAGRKRGMHRPQKAPELALGETMYLLGQAWCSCGRRMTMYGTKGRARRYNYYRCTGRREGLCQERDISAERMHQAVIGELIALSRTPWRLRVLLAEISKTYGDTGEIERELLLAQRRVKALDTQQAKLASAIGLSPAEAIPALTSQLGKVALERHGAAGRAEAIAQELERARRHRPDRAFLESVLGQFAQAWELATEAERRELAQLMIPRVEVKSTGLEVWILEASRGNGSSRGKLSALVAAGAQINLDEFPVGCLMFSANVRSSRVSAS